LFEKRKHAKHIGKLDKYPKLKQYVHEKLKVEWSPEEIAGRLKNESKKRLSVTKVFTTTFTSETDGMKTGISCYRMVGQNDKRNGEEKGLKY
jgi:IS30 family transposase